MGPNLWEKTLPYDADLKVTQVSIIHSLCSGCVNYFMLNLIQLLHYTPALPNINSTKYGLELVLDIAVFTFFAIVM